MKGKGIAPLCSGRFHALSELLPLLLGIRELDHLIF